VFITVEGGEGVGKSFFVSNLTELLVHRGVNLCTTREPGGTGVADYLRNIFVNPPAQENLTVEAEFCIVSAARAQHVAHKIIPALKEKKLVLCDRFADSSRVYQGTLGGIAEDVIERVIALTTYGCVPDLTFLLDCEEKISFKRLQDRASENGGVEISRFDAARRDFHSRLKLAFLNLRDKFSERIVVIDSSQTKEKMMEAAIAEIKKRFGADTLDRPIL
jgi:dTMP kinase